MRMSSLETDNESQKEEVKEVLKALEELAINFDQKQQEAESKSKENETLTLELDKKLTNLKSIEDELETLKEVAQNQRKRLFEMMIIVLKDLGEIGAIVGGSLTNEFKKPSIENFENVEEDFTMSRLYVSKLKAEAKMLTQRCFSLEEQKTESEKTYDIKVKELEECRLNLVQNEARLKSQQDYSKDLEQKKRSLEEEIDTLREDLAKAKAQGQRFFFVFKFISVKNLTF
jgi:kinesin family member 5